MTTRKLLAKIDREVDVYVVLDRMRQAIYDESDYAEGLEKRLLILEEAERKRITDTGVHKAIRSELLSRELEKTGKISAWVAGIAALLAVAFFGWLATMVWKGMHAP